MSAKRGASGLSGILLVDKPAGMTSHDVVNRVRRAAGEKRVGHAGTLDPMATGLLVVLVGPATRLEPYLSSRSKAYEATIAFGTATDTDDAEGETVRTAPVPPSIFDPAFAERTLAGFLGDSEQLPPAYSAIKVGGTVAHRAARSGSALELAPRPIHVAEAYLASIDETAATWHVNFLVSKGTYIRALARDIGESVGSAAHLSGLRRSASGDLRVSRAHSLDEIARAGEAGQLETLFTDPVEALGLDVLPEQVDAAHVLQGRALEAPGARAEEDGALACVLVDGGRLGALYRLSGGRWVPEVVLATPIARAA